MSAGPRFTQVVRDLPATIPFTGPEALERVSGRPFAARLGANESVFGPSPRAVAAIAEAAKSVWMYGDPETHALAQALSRHHDIECGSIVVGEGIDGLLGLLVRLLVAPDDPVVTSLGGYPTFAYHVRAAGGRLHEVPYREDRPDLDGLAETARATGAKIVYLANPDNPMGTWHGAVRVQGLRDALPEGCVLALDEAYLDFAPAAAAPLFDTADPCLIRLRTFSKAYGLAGLRVGYAVTAPAFADAFDKIRNHFGVGRLAQAGALAALQDTEWLAHVTAAVAAGRDRIRAIARANGLVARDSAANFVALDCGGDAARARAVLDGLAAHGVFVRMPGAPPLNRCIRVTVGDDDDLALFETALADVLDAFRA